MVAVDFVAADDLQINLFKQMTELSLGLMLGLLSNAALKLFASICFAVLFPCITLEKAV